MEFTVRNVNEALSEALWKLKVMGVESPSRNGPVLAFPEPVTTVYNRPKERVLFWEARDANPIFHLMESIWMLSGRNDIAFPAMFNLRIGQYSDDGQVFNAAYGYRWRRHFGIDQVTQVIELLRRDPDTRQAVIQMWDPADLTKVTKDKACNTQIFFDIRMGQLNMTVLCRSNDIWYGAYGANAVHFSFLMELVAGALGVPVGLYRQYSHNLHLYTELYDAKKYLESPPNCLDYDGYWNGVTSRDIMDNGNYSRFLSDCEQFCEDPFRYRRYYHRFFEEVAYPMAMVSKSRKDKLSTGQYWAERIEAEDWKLATLQWIARREKAKVVKS